MRKIIAITCAACMLCLGARPHDPGASLGGIEDRILAAAQQCQSRATAARDRAIQARDNAADARDSIDESVQNLREGLARITGEMRTTMEEALEDLQRTLVEQLEGRAEFTADGGCSVDVCEPFRDNLIALLQGTEDNMNMLYEIAGVDGMHADFERPINVIRNMPGRVLMPLYRVLVEQNNAFGGGLLDILPDTLQRLQMLRDAMEHIRSDTPENGETRLDLELSKCQWWDDNFEILRPVGTELTGFGVLFKGLGGLLRSIGTTEFTGRVGATVVNGELTSSPVKAVGEVWDKYADALFMVSNFISNKTRYCTEIIVKDDIRQAILNAKDRLANRQDDILLQQDAILQGQQVILAAIEEARCK